MAVELFIGSHRVGHGGKAAHSAVCRHPHELLRIAKGQGPQQDRVHDAEDGDVGADAQRQDQHGDRRKSPVASQRAQRVPQVLQQHIEHRQSARFAMLLLRLRDAAEAHQGGWLPRARGRAGAIGSARLNSG